MITRETSSAGLWIGGKWRAAVEGKTLQVFDPATEEEIAVVSAAGKRDVEEAYQSARRAFIDRRWSGLPPLERSRILHDIAARIRKQQYEIAALMTRENGMPMNQALFLEIPLVIDVFDYFAALVTRPLGEVMPFSTIGSEQHHFSVTVREPIGVAGLITPWNFPLLMPAWKIAPALASGCSAILKPAPETPLVALKLAEICNDAGVPAGVINVLPGDDEAGKAIVRHPGIEKIAFTGETKTGRRIYENAAPHIKRISLELGGKSPNIVFADADIRMAARSALFGVFYNSGQICQAGSRILVQQSVYEEFLERIVAMAKRLTVGPGENSDTDLGPLISQEQFDKVTRYIEKGKKEGAVLLCGGSRPAGLGKGFFLEPTIFGEVRPDMAIAREEIFGPVACVIPFADEEEALAIANDTIYGLAAAVWTNHVKKGWRVAQKIQAGTVWMNTYQVLSPTMPFGGYKQSGIGRELGGRALEAYMETKSIICDLNERPSTFF